MVGMHPACSPDVICQHQRAGVTDAAFVVPNTVVASDSVTACAAEAACGVVVAVADAAAAAVDAPGAAFPRCSDSKLISLRLVPLAALLAVICIAFDRGLWLWLHHISIALKSAFNH